MRQYLFEHGGLDTEGIFRIAPDKDEADNVKTLLDKVILIILLFFTVS